MFIEREMIMRTLQILSLLVLATSAVGCTTQNLCNRISECEEEDRDGFSDDAAAVCAAEIDSSLAALRANEEEVCHRLADAANALNACKAGLSCDDLAEADLGKECDDQLDDFKDALDDVDGNECSAQED